MPDNSSNPGNLWVAYALLTVVTWGIYGVFLHNGKTAMTDPTNGGYKAFLWVGIAYVLIAVLAPCAMLVANKASWGMPSAGVLWSLLAGIVGAIGAFGVILAFGAKGQPAVVMSIIFAGAPVVNALVAILMHPPAEGSLRWQFFAGILLAAAGGMLVTLYKPAAPAPPGAGGAHAVPAPAPDAR